MAESAGIFLSETDQMSANDEHLSARMKKWLESVNKFSFGRLTSIGIGCLLYACAFMIHFQYLKSNFYISVKTTKEDPITFFLWHLGVVVGCTFCGWNWRTWPTRIANIIIGVILLASGSLICLKHFIWRDAMFIVGVARLMAGVCFGFIYITTLVHIGDNVPKNMRGYVSTTLAMASLIGGFSMSISHEIGTATQTPGHNEAFADETIYIWIMMTMILITLCLTLKKTPEPITWYLKSGKIDGARSMLDDLWQGIVHPADIQNEFDERMKFMSEDYEECGDECCFFRIFTHGNWKPIVLMLFLRMTNVMVFFIQFLCFDEPSYECYIVHFIALFVVKYCLDTVGRWWFLFCGVFPGILLIPYLSFSGSIQSINPCLVILIFGIEPAMHVYSSEAFPFSKRNGSLAFVTSFEYIFGVTAILSFLFSGQVMILGAIIISFVAFLLSIFFIPKTTCLSIRQSRDEFNRFYKPNVQNNEMNLN